MADSVTNNETTMCVRFKFLTDPREDTDLMVNVKNKVKTAISKAHGQRKHG